jgi:hypothetical protein
VPENEAGNVAGEGSPGKVGGQEGASGGKTGWVGDAGAFARAGRQSSSVDRDGVVKRVREFLEIFPFAALWRWERRRESTGETRGNAGKGGPSVHNKTCVDSVVSRCFQQVILSPRLGLLIRRL